MAHTRGTHNCYLPFNWNAAVGSLDDGDGSLIDETGGRDTNEYKADDASREGVEVDTMATAEQKNNSWFSPLANYFTNPRLGDIGLTEAEEEDDDRDESEDKDAMRRSRSRRIGKSKRILRRRWMDWSWFFEREVFNCIICAAACCAQNVDIDFTACQI